jgi:hypothetical protein
MTKKAYSPGSEEVLKTKKHQEKYPIPLNNNSPCPI